MKRRKRKEKKKARCGIRARTRNERAPLSSSRPFFPSQSRIYTYGGPELYKLKAKLSTLRDARNARVYRREKTCWQKSPFVISIVGSFKYARPRGWRGRFKENRRRPRPRNVNRASSARRTGLAEGRKGGLDKKWARGSRLSAPSSPPLLRRRV